MLDIGPHRQKIRIFGHKPVQEKGNYIPVGTGGIFDLFLSK